MSQRPVNASAAGLVLVDDLAERLSDGVFVLVLPGDGNGSGVEVWVTRRGDALCCPSPRSRPWWVRVGPGSRGCPSRGISCAGSAPSCA